MRLRKGHVILLSALVLLGIGLVIFGKGLWIFGKAQLSQILINRAWHKTLDGGGSVKPWKWADFHPLARLESPAHDFAAVVLDNASGSALAFAPGHHQGSALPGQTGNCIISAHRETYFGFFKNIKQGDIFALTAADGNVFEYTVVAAEVADANIQKVKINADQPYLTLVTCYPFNTMVTGNKRFVVTAVHHTIE